MKRRIIMKKSISIIAAAAMAASLTLAGTMSAFAADEEPTTQASTEAATEAEPSIKIADIAGKWKYQVADGNTSVDKAAKDNGVVEIKDDSTFSYTDAEGKTSTGTVKIGTETIESTVADTVNFYVGDELSFGGYYHSDSKEISIGNGGTARLVADNGETETTTTEATTTEGTTTSTTTTTTATTTASSTTAKATTAANSPKTGVAFPAIAIAGVGAAVATAFVLRKKED